MFQYKRENHFKEWLDQIDIESKKQHVQIPTGLLEKLQNSGEPLNTRKDIVKVLRKLGKNRYIEFINRISHELGILRIPELTEKHKRGFEKLHNQMLTVYWDCVPKERKSFIPYSYVMYRFSVQLGYKEWEEYFSKVMIKSEKGRKSCDEIYDRCCQKLGW